KGSFYEAVVEDGSDIIFIVDYSGLICYHNASTFETLGYRSKSLIGRNIFDYLLPSMVSSLKNKFKQRSEERRVGKEGRSKHTRFSRDWSSDVCSSDLKGVVL